MGTRRIHVPAALDLAGARAFAAALEAASGDPACRAVRIEGVGGEFCRGLDFESFSAGAAAVGDGMAAFVNCLKGIREAGVPVIAVVDGPALGGGLGIAAACDVIVATPRATFGLPEALFGLMPAAVRALKRFTSELSSPRLFDAVESGAALTARTLDGGQVAEHLKRFLAGEPAPWIEGAGE